MQRIKFFYITLPLLGLIVTALLTAGPNSYYASAAANQKPILGNKSLAQGNINSPSVMFIENVGQFDEGAMFKVYGSHNTIWLTHNAIWVTLLELKEDTALEEPFFNRPHHHLFNEPEATKAPRKGVNIRLSFSGANLVPEIKPTDSLETTVSYFIGNDPNEWQTDVPVWGSVRYVDLYPGLDLELDNGMSVLRFVCRTADCKTALSAVNLTVEGAEAISLIGEEIAIETTVGNINLPLFTIMDAAGNPLVLEESKPIIHENTVMLPFAITKPDHFVITGESSQNSGGTDYSLSNTGTLEFSTFLGGSGPDQVSGLKRDTDGNIIVTGRTSSTDFPTTPGAYDTTHDGNNDVFVARLTADGSGLIYSTFLGGSSGDGGNDLVLDSTGNATITGYTLSNEFPTTPGAYDTTHNGNTDGFVAQLDADGSDLIFSTFLGGIDDDYPRSLAIDLADDITLTGEVASVDFPTTPGAYDSTLNGTLDVFVTKINATGDVLVYSTYLGGNDSEHGDNLTIDPAGNATLTGVTRSNDFPTTPGAFDTTYNGGVYDVFVTQLNTDASDLIYSTYMGGSDVDYGDAIILDAAGNATITGTTQSTNFPTTPGAYNTTYNGGILDVYITQLNSDGSGLNYSTYLGGSSDDAGYAMILDPAGNATISGKTGSSDFPTTPDAYDTTYNGGRDVFITQLTSDGSDLNYSTYLGGSDVDSGDDPALTETGNIIVTGITRSANFPTTPGAYDTSYNGEYDTFILQLNVTPVPDFTLFVDPVTQNICTGTDAVYNANVGSINGFNFPVTLSTQGEPAGTTTDFSVNPVTPPGMSTLVISGTSGVVTGSYSIDIIGTAPTRTHTTTVGLNLLAAPASPILVSPPDGAASVPITPTFNWSGNGISYTIDIATDSTFTNIVETATVTDTMYASAGLASETTYYWRVTGSNSCGPGMASVIFSFTTVDIMPNLPDIDVSLDELEVTQPPDTTMKLTLTISNLGTADLDWFIYEELSLLANDTNFEQGSHAPSPGMASNNRHFTGLISSLKQVLDTTTLLGLADFSDPENSALMIQQGIDLGNVVGGCASNNLPWIGISPSNGTTSAGNNSYVDVTFDSTGLVTGVYTGTLCIESNDPVNPEVRVSLTLNVEEPLYELYLPVMISNTGSTVPPKASLPWYVPLVGITVVAGLGYNRLNRYSFKPA